MITLVCLEQYQISLSQRSLLKRIKLVLCCTNLFKGNFSFPLVIISNTMQNISHFTYKWLLNGSYDRIDLTVPNVTDVYQEYCCVSSHVTIKKFLFIRHFHKHIKFAIMALMSTLYSHKFVVFFLTFGSWDVSKCKIRCQPGWQKVCRPLKDTDWSFMFLNDTAKIKLAMLAILCCREIVKTSTCISTL